LTAEKGSVDFQIESARSFLIENMQFLWCDGHVETQSMRLSPGIEDYRVTFYCDRLNLAKVLEQFGAAAAEGQGTVNGRIPLQYANGKISFEDGFLFSTPGDGGKIRITGSETLTAGIPPDTPQYVQMELASEALKDYDYSWAKLNITSQGDELLLQMQMDGKPAKTLPFVYRKDIGGFAKVEADVAGSKFQGIRLDVNFRLPLNKLLQYKSLMNMMQKSD
jgi:prepilin-type processing-associated H-X9-DG protein